MNKYIYLAGPVIGLTGAEANDWRTEFSALLPPGIVGISPLRCEPPAANGRYSQSYPDVRFGTTRAISSKNFLDVQSCDLTLAYLPQVYNDRRPSYGTVSELAWARALGKPTILVSEDARITEHPVIQANSGWIVATLDEARDIITGIFGEYANPTNARR